MNCSTYCGLLQAPKKINFDFSQSPKKGLTRPATGSNIQPSMQQTHRTIFRQSIRHWLFSSLPHRLSGTGDVFCRRSSAGSFYSGGLTMLLKLISLNSRRFALCAHIDGQMKVLAMPLNQKFRAKMLIDHANSEAELIRLDAEIRRIQRGSGLQAVGV